MRGSLRWIAALAVGVVVAIAVFAATAEAHTGTVAISCDQVTFSFASFPQGSSTVDWQVTVDGHQRSGSTVIQGSAASFTVALGLVGGEHKVVASVSWKADGGGSASGQNLALHCAGSPPPPPDRKSVV